MATELPCIQLVRFTDGLPTPVVLCDDNGPFLTIVTVQPNGTTEVAYKELDGTPYVPVGSITLCDTDDNIDVEQRLFCDDNAGVITPYLVAYEYDETGAIIGTTITLIDGVTPYVPTGITRVCAGEDGDVEIVTLCDDNGSFLRQVIFDNVGVVIGTNDTLLDATTPYVTVGNVATCDIVNLPENFIPSGSGNDERLEIIGAVTQSGMVITVGTTHIEWRIEGGAVRYTIDGSSPIGGVDPATGNGHIVRGNDSDRWTVEKWQAAKWIRNTSLSGWIHASQVKPKGA